MKYVGVVQVKYESGMFPGKALAHFGELTAIEYLLTRLKKADFLHEIIVATTVDPCDDIIVEAVSKTGYKIFRGDGSDVLGRIYFACREYAPDGIVKIMGNAPLIDIDEMKKLILRHHEGGFDYSYNENVDGVIYGMGCSVFSFDILEQLNRRADMSKEQREIGSLYIRQHPERFKTFKGVVDEAYPKFRVLIEQAKDVEMIKSIIKLVPDINNNSVGKFLTENPLLVDYQMGPGISETGIDKIFLFPDKTRQYLNGNIDSTYPVSVELSLTNKCNFDCDWCSDGDLRKRLGGEFEIDELKRLFSDLFEGGTKGIVIEGGGEPMLHSQFDEIVKAVKNAGLAVGLITNGSVMLKDETINYFDWIRISLDAATPEQHSKWKKAKVFERIMGNIKNIGDKKSKTILGIGYVVTRHNIDGLEDLLMRLRYYKVDYIQFRPVIDHSELSSEKDLIFLKKFESPSFRVDINAMYANQDTGNAGVSCLAHSLSAVITADGGVYMCGRLNIYDWVKPIGNVRVNSFREVWMGDERRRQSQMVADEGFCIKHCPECRMTKYNLVINKARRIKTKNFI